MHRTLTGNEMIADALEQMISHTNMLHEQYKAGTGEYEMVSARGVLYILGFDSNDAQSILEYISENGFNYCLDYNIRIHDGVFPDQQVCYYGADALHSRLNCVTKPRTEQ